MSLGLSTNQKSIPTALTCLIGSQAGRPFSERTESELVDLIRTASKRKRTTKLTGSG